jgi:hypothetical protein
MKRQGPFLCGPPVFLQLLCAQVHLMIQMLELLQLAFEAMADYTLVA